MSSVKGNDFRQAGSSKGEEGCEQQCLLKQTDQVIMLRNCGQAAKGNYFYFSF